MYKIIKRNPVELVGLCDEPRYVAFIDGTYVRARDKSKADAVVFGGNLYNFGDTEKIAGAPFVYVIEIDGGEFVFDLQKSVAETNAAIDDIIITMLEG